jgi:hypothetical protein
MELSIMPLHREHNPDARKTDPGRSAEIEAAGLPVGATLLVPVLTVAGSTSITPVIAGQAVIQLNRRGPAPSLAPDCFTSTDGGVTLVARRSGRLACRDGRTTIVPLFDLNGHVNGATGDIEFTGDVLVRGNVSNRAQVRCTGDLWVVGNVEAATLHVGGSVHVGGSISGKGKGQVTAGGDLFAERIGQATVCVDGAVAVAVDIVASQVDCGKMLTAERGAIFASQIVATGGVRCAALGSPGDTRTTVEVGVDHRFIEVARKRMIVLNQLRHRAEELRKGLEPYIRLRATLSPRQREQTTALLFQADELETQHSAGIDWLRAALARSNAAARARVEVTRAIHGSDVLGFPLLAGRTLAGQADPLHLELRTIDGVARAVAVSSNGAIIETDATQPARNETMDALQKLLGSPATPTPAPLVAA